MYEYYIHEYYTIVVLLQSEATIKIQMTVKSQWCTALSVILVQKVAALKWGACFQGEVRNRGGGEIRKLSVETAQNNNGSIAQVE